MNNRIKVTVENATYYFYLEKLTPERSFCSFLCPVAEYNDYLIKDAIRSLNDHIAKTWLYPQCRAL